MQVLVKITPDVPSDAMEYQALLLALTGSFLVKVPLKEVTYTETTPLVYTYTFTTVDGRTWQQEIYYRDKFSGDPVLSLPFSTDKTDRWLVPELQAHTEFQAILITLTRKFGVTLVQLQWGEVRDA
jgi:hypothetical protein